MTSQTDTVDYFFTLTHDGKYLVLFENRKNSALLGIEDDPSSVLDSLNSRPEVAFAKMD